MIYSVAFEGPNRVGKGTQIALTARYLEQRNVPYVILRGSGSRLASGESIGDPRSSWWDAMQDRLKTTADLEAWEAACVRLAREYIVWRDYSFPRLLQHFGHSDGILLVDRSILSRSMLTREQGRQDWKHLFPADARSAGRPITADLVCPDVLLNLVASKEELQMRLDPSDPKYAFRKLLIRQKSEWFSDAVATLPPHIRSRTTTIYSVGNEREVFEQIRNLLETKIRILTPPDARGN